MLPHNGFYDVVGLLLQPSLHLPSYALFIIRKPYNVRVACIQNKLARQIPLQLIQHTFLESFNVSHNQLIGPIPHGKQFDTFANSLFDGKSGLCGSSLSKKCEKS